MKVETVLRLYYEDIRYCSEEFLNYLRENEVIDYWNLRDLLSLVDKPKDFRIYDILSDLVYNDSIDVVKIVLPKKKWHRKVYKG